ncbi:hypothetical protein Tco_0386302 [Tanacetum coccineum]
MVNTNAFLEANWHRKNKHICQPQQWYQSKILGKPLRRMSQSEFAQRHIKREKEERIGHIFKSCPAKIKNEVEHAQGLPTEIAKGNIEANNTTQAKNIKQNMLQFGQEFGALAEILGLPRSDGEEIRNGNTGAPIAEEKEKKKLDHFGIKLEEEEDCKEQQSAYYGKDQSQVICYRCQSSGHHAFEYPNKNRKKHQVKYSSYKEASTSKLSDKGDSHSTSSDDYIVIT